LAEIARKTMNREFRRIDPASARIVVVEAGDRLLEGFAPELSARARADLGRMGIEVMAKAKVVDVRADGVTVHADGRDQVIAAGTVLWGAGVRASPLCRAVAEAIGAELDRSGRLLVDAECALPGHPEVFVIGDAARFELPGDPSGRPLPGLAAVAMQQGRHVARVIAARLAGRAPAPFRYRDYGSMATIGKRLAVGEIAGWKLRGTLAWLVWVFVHIMKLVGFQSRLLVLVQWAWYWISWDRSARLITGEGAEHAVAPAPPPAAPAPLTPPREPPLPGAPASGSQPRRPGSAPPPPPGAPPATRAAPPRPAAPPPAG
jgi:NADH dehydrogenase